MAQSPAVSAGIWTLVILGSFILGISFGLFVLSYTFAIATWDKAMSTVQTLFGKYVTLRTTSPVIIAVFTSLAILVNWLRRRDIRQLFSDFRFGTAGTRSILICMLAILAIVYVIASIVKPETFLMPIVERLYTGFYNFFKSFTESAMYQAFSDFGKLALLFTLLTIYIFMTPLALRAVSSISARDLSTVSIVATGLGIMFGAISIPLTEVSLSILQEMWSKAGPMSILGVFGGIIAFILLMVAIEDLRRWILYETRAEYLMHVPAGLIVINTLLKQFYASVYGTVMGTIYLIAVLVIFATYFFGLALGRNSLVAAASATFPMLLYISLT